MRIVAGEYRSRKLNTLSGVNTRPTQDKIKEAIFSCLGTYFYEGKMLDLFAGSGSMGLEGLSRGLEKVYFCDHHKEAIKVIESNIDNLKVQEKCVICNMDYKVMLEKFKKEKFTLIFIDPPYDLKPYDECFQIIDKYDMLDEEGVIVVESAKEDIFKEQYGNLIKYKEKEYGITRITYYQKES